MNTEAGLQVFTKTTNDTRHTLYVFAHSFHAEMCHTFNRGRALE